VANSAARMAGVADDEARHQTAGKTAGSRSLTCKKCRLQLLEEPRHRMMNLQGEDERANVYYIYEDTLPEWISDAVEEGNWTKGKLCCPSCKTRVGGFDFVTSLSGSPVYIVRSKVDLRVAGTEVLLVKPKEKIEGAETMQTSTTSTSSEGSIVKDVLDQEEEEDSSENESNTESDHVDASKESSSTDEELVLRSKKQKNKMRKRRRRKEALALERVREIEVITEQEKRKEVLRKVMEAEPELNHLPDDLVCPVCLDLLHEPFQVEPCGHIFCEPCLRRLGQKNPMSCSCPMCRTKIGFCKHLAATSREIREEHEALYLKRKKFERSTPVFSYPLPWQPGWRNLLRGRPLGGNRFVIRDNR